MKELSKRLGGKVYGTLGLILVIIGFYLNELFYSKTSLVLSVIAIISSWKEYWEEKSLFSTIGLVGGIILFILSLLSWLIYSFGGSWWS